MAAKLKAIKVELQRRKVRSHQSGWCMAPQGRIRLLPHTTLFPGNIDQLRIFQESRQSALAERSGSPQPNREEEVGRSLLWSSKGADTITLRPASLP